ncbi:MAG: hypothetical protein MHM6MM_007283 [Cercozoa sp. M6MM]
MPFVMKNNKPSGQHTAKDNPEIAKIEEQLVAQADLVSELEPGPDKFNADLKRQELAERLWEAQGLGSPVF